jgi:steroid 5-alpha reductase family enzyme
MKMKHFIDSQKGATVLAVLLIMYWHDAWLNTAAWIYLALHGSYGVMWVMKSRLFGDHSWEAETSPAYGALIWVALSLYWVTPWIISANNVNPPAPYLALCIALFAFGVFFHFAADMQKHMHLEYRPGTLLTEGVWASSRNPNYFGELLIYLGFSLLAMHWAPLAVLALFIAFVWLPNMRRKDKSLSRYPEFEDYRRRTGWIIPRIL